MTLNKVKVTCEGHISLEVIKVYYAHLVKYCVFTYYHHKDKKYNNAKRSIPAPSQAYFHISLL